MPSFKWSPSMKCSATWATLRLMREVVVAGGDDQVGPADGAVFVHFVVMDQDAARGFDHAHAFQAVHAGGGAHVGVEDGGIGEQEFDLFQPVQQFDQARVVVVEGAVHDGAAALTEFGELGVGRGAEAFGGVQARERAHAVDARGIAQRLEVRRLQVGIFAGRLRR